MPNYYSPKGNLEVWESKPIGYFEPDEWEKKHPRELESKSLAQLKDEKLAEIKSAFSAIKQDGAGSLNVEGVGVINAGGEHLDNIQNMIKKLEIDGGELNFRIYDNSFVVVDITKLKAMEKALIDYGLTCYGKMWQYQSAVEQANSASEVEAIKVEFNG